MKPRALLQQTWTQSSNLAKALTLSLALHSLLLAVKFVAPEAFEFKNIESPLEVVLVNAKSAQRPNKPTVIAQNDLNGGGEHENQRATTPLPAQTAELDGDLVRQTQKRVDLLEVEQRRLLSQLMPSKTSTRAPNLKTGAQQFLSQLEGRDNITTEKEVARIEAELAREMVHESKRPKRAYLSATSAEGKKYARYYDNVRKKIEARGTENFPVGANGQPLYGDLVLIVFVNRSGQLGYNKEGWLETTVKVERSSGNPTLDRQAVAIVRAAAPFGAFSAEMRSQYDILEIISTFKFTREGLATALQAQ